jgi:alpha-galactosidase
MTTRKKNPSIALIGAGSQVFGFSMCTDICQTPALKGADIRLVDVDARRLKIMEDLFALISRKTGMELKISATTDRGVALSGSDFVIVSVARDRINRWDKDLEISRRYGIVETQGECGGPGGLSLTLRNIPLLLEIAKDVERLAPDAVILNFSNPMTRVCLAINRYTRVRCVGLCHGLIGVQHLLSKLLNREVLVKGCGINHFNWIFSAAWSDTGEDALKAVEKTCATNDIPKYTRELFDVFGRIVTPDDGHITDFIHHWRGAAGGLNPRYHLKPKNMDAYRKSAVMWEQKIADYLSGKSDPLAGVSGLSGEGAIPIITTMSGITASYTEIAANLPNHGAIENLPDDSVVEVPAQVSPGDIQGVKMGSLPEGIKSLIARQLDIADLAVEAAVEGSYQKALQALAIDPIIPDIQIARSYLDDILQAHRAVLPQFTLPS